MAISSLMMRLRPMIRNFTLVSVGERAHCREVLLGIVRVDLLSIELGVLRYNLRLDLAIGVFLVNLFSDLWDGLWCHIFRHLDETILITGTKYEQCIDDSVLRFDPVDEASAGISVMAGPRCRFSMALGVFSLGIIVMIALAVVVVLIIALVVLGALAGYLNSLIREIAAELVRL